MQTICKKDTAYLSYIPENHRQYIKFIKLVLKNTDKICFTVKPCLDNLEEFAQSIRGFMCDSVLIPPVNRQLQIVLIQKVI